MVIWSRDQMIPCYCRVGRKELRCILNVHLPLTLSLIKYYIEQRMICQVGILIIKKLDIYHNYFYLRMKLRT